MLDHGQHFRSPEFEDARKQELWTETKQGWLNRLADGRSDVDRLNDLCRDIETEAGQCRAWGRVSDFTEYVDLGCADADDYMNAVDAIEEMEMPHD